jgi:PAS domain S-box-containing protein
MAKRVTRTRKATPTARRAPPATGGIQAGRIDLVMRAVNEGIYDWDIARGTIFYSEGVRRATGMTARDIRTPGDWRNRIHPDDLPAYDAALIAHFKGRTERFECDYRFRDKRGGWRWARQHGIAERDARGRATRLVGSTGDITELKRAEQALLDAQERLALATQAASEGIYDWDVATGSLFLSERAKAYFAVEGRKLTPAAWNALVHKEDFAGYRAAIAAFFRSRRTQFECEYRIRKSGGGLFWILDRAVAVRDADGRVTRMVGAIADITPRKQHEIELRRARDEATSALKRQTATAEILKVIASSPSDVQPVFERIVQNVRQLFGTRFAVLQLLRGDGMVEMAAIDGDPGYPVFRKLRERYPRPLDESTVGGHAMLSKQAFQLAPVIGSPSVPSATEQFARDFGFNSVIFSPMIHEGSVIGAIGAAHHDARPFDARQVALIKTFADQAVIAIQNARLFNETKEALERQTATAGILNVIASSPSDVQPVLDAIARSAFQLLSGAVAGVLLRKGAGYRLAALYTDKPAAATPPSPDYVPIDPAANFPSRVFVGKSLLHIPDWTAIELPPHEKRVYEGLGIRSSLMLPLMRADECIGVLFVSRSVVHAYADREIALMQSFADQAAIAIENVRLFNETKEALERQTATAEVLRVIGSSVTDIQPVFDIIAERAARLTGAEYGWVFRFDGEQIHVASLVGVNAEGMEAARRAFPMRPSGGSVTARAVRDGKVVNVADVMAEDDAEYKTKEIAKLAGYRSVLSVPMIRDRQTVGAITVSRAAVGEFGDKEVELLSTFASQAVIAIENVRLFNETREALERQTATAEILKVIASTPSDVQPVFEAIVQSGVRLFNDAAVAVVRPVGREVQLMAIAEADPERAVKWASRFPFPLEREYMHSAAILDCAMVDVPDALEEQESFVEGRKNFALSGYRAMTVAPMVRDNVAIGAISVVRAAPGPLSEKQKALLTTFADQAVIAIENVRLFKELQSRTEALTKSVGQLTALGEVGQAISSTLDLDTVLQTIVSRAVQLTAMDGGTIYEFDEPSGEFRLRASENMAAELVEVYRRMPIRLGEGVVGGAVARREPVQVPDIQGPEYQSRYRELLIGAGYRAILAVPLLREEQIIGALTVSRNAAGEFPPETIELLKTFATQSALAIQNARLFREIADKGRQLEEASRHKSNFLASMSHELRTPLNAILGFNEMLLGEVYGEVPADMKEPLEDIQKSGKHLLRLINNVLDLAKIEAGRMELSLQDYSVHDTVESVRATLRPLAAEKGLEFLATVPNEVPLAHGDGGRIAQCLLNLAGNSLKFTKQGTVEIAVELRGELLIYRVTDTGIGIPPDKIASLFTEFKQTDATIASEYGGTGLGLSISRKFVEMHGGRIWIESELGRGSSFFIEVPLRVTAP